MNRSLGTIPMGAFRFLMVTGLVVFASMPLARAACGDGIVDGTEQCDGQDLAGSTCQALGYTSGSLRCSPTCTFDTSGCSSAACGNGIRDTGEQCDGGDLGGNSCVSLGYASGTLGCRSTCTFDTSGCSTTICGNGIREAGEQCDGGDLGGNNCATLGFTSGTLGCKVSCQFDTSACTSGPAVCGNGLAEAGEQCDGSDFFGNTCVNLGFTGGVLACTPTCLIDSSGCTSGPGTCGDGILDPGEQCDAGPANGVPGSGCDASCRLEVVGRCGDGILDPGEQCDAGSANGVPGSGCTSFCTLMECSFDADCNDQFACNGVEFCDPMIFRCLPGMPVNCDDTDPCTIDSCDPMTGGCRHVATGDEETAGGPDGACNTLDDNLEMFGPDRTCGTTDDLPGDGTCTAIDNCPLAFNPAQQDSDRDGLGDACDAATCREISAYVTDFDRLVRVDIATGGILRTYPGAGGELTDVKVNQAETQAYVTQRDVGRVLGIDLASGTAFDLGNGLAQPWGIALSPDQSFLLVTESGVGDVSRINVPGGGMAIPIASGLSGPRGIALDPTGTRAYVAEYLTGRLLQIPVGGGMPITRATGLSGPTGVTLNPAGTFAFVTEADSGELSAVSLSSGAVVLITGGLSSPQGIALDATGAIAYVAERSGRLTAIDLSTGAQNPLPVPLMSPSGVDVGRSRTIVMSLPDGATGAPGTVKAIPVSVTDLTGQGVLSADILVRYNPAVLTASSVTPGTLGTGCTIVSNLSTPGLVAVSFFCLSARSGAGSLVNLNFTVTGTTGTATPLDLVEGILNEGEPAVCLENGSLVVPVRISGRISYYRDHVTSAEPSVKRVPGAVLDLSANDPPVPGPLLMSATTACGGDYALNNVLPGRNYVLTPRKANDFGVAIDPFDASLNAQHVVGLISLTAYQRLAADVTGNGTLSSLDSARIAQFSVGLITQFPVAVLNGDWVFIPTPQFEPNASVFMPVPQFGTRASIEYTPLIESAENQDFLGVLFGDVSGNWLPPICSPASGGSLLALDTTAAAEATARIPPGGGQLAMPSLSATPGQILRVPIQGTGVADAVSFYLDVQYDPSVLRLLDATAGAGTAGFSVTTNLAGNGRGRVALYRATKMGADGEVAVLSFKVVGLPGMKSSIRLPAYTVNEGRIAVSVTEGRIEVGRFIKRPR